MKQPNTPSDEALKIARQSVATAPGNVEEIKYMLRHMRMASVADLVDEHLLLCNEILRLAGEGK